MNTTASPVPAVLSGTEYKIKPLSDQALESLGLWVRAHFLKSIRLSLKGETDAQIVQSTTQTGHAFSLGIEWDNEHGQKCLVETRGGRARMLSESLLPTTPAITYNKCLELMKPEENEAAFWEAFDLANDLISGKEDLSKKKTTSNDGPTSEGE